MRKEEDTQTLTQGVIGTISWVAPEVIDPEVEGKRIYTTKSDVYSYGIMLWELLTRRIPFDEFKNFEVPVKIMKGKRPTIPPDSNSGYAQLLKRCWQHRAADRPTTKEVIDDLETLIFDGGHKL